MVEKKYNSNGHQNLFGNYIRDLRIQRGIGQRELARKIEVSASYLNDIEKNNKASELPHERFLMSNLRNEVELQNIIAALEIAPTRNEAAEKLGISPRTLRYKINKLRDLGMPVPAAYARI